MFSIASIDLQGSFALIRACECQHVSVAVFLVIVGVEVQSSILITDH